MCIPSTEAGVYFPDIRPPIYIKYISSHDYMDIRLNFLPDCLTCRPTSWPASEASPAYQWNP